MNPMNFFVNIYRNLVSKTSDMMFVFKPFQISEIKSKDCLVPKPRSGHRIVTDDEGNVYSYGGYNPNIDDDPDLMDDEDWLETKPLFKELWKFNISNKKWIKLKTSGEAPVHLASHCVVLVDRYLFVFGGTGCPFGFNSSNKLYVCNLDTLKWNLIKAHGDIPQEQYGQAMVYDHHENCLYVVGGTNGYIYSIDIHQFDFDKMEWKILFKKSPTKYNAWPLERYRHEMALYSNKLFIIGGGTAQECYDLKLIPVFDTHTCTWSEAQTFTGESDGSFPSNRKYHGLVQIEYNVYVAGGTNGSDIFDDIWNLDLNTLIWKKIHQKIPRPVFFHSVSLSPFGEMTIFGGVTGMDFSSLIRSNELYSIWLKVPKLKELSWLAVCHYMDNNKVYKNCLESVQYIGIPYNYHSRLICKS